MNALSPSRNFAKRRLRWRVPMFGHQRISIGRHCTAVLGSALLTSSVFILLSIVIVVVQIELLGYRYDRHGLGTGQMVLAGMMGLWLPCFVALLISGAPWLTLGWGLSRPIRHSFGWGFVAWGALGGLLIARMQAAFGGYFSIAELMTYAALGMAMGFTYWACATGYRAEVEAKDSSQLELGFS